MSFTEMLTSFGIELPSPAYWVGLVLFGVIGLVAWYHGRRTKQPAPKWLGLALMLYPYATPQTWLLYSVGAALCVWLILAWR
jgi:hypothetical protein